MSSFGTLTGQVLISRLEVGGAAPCPSLTGTGRTPLDDETAWLSGLSQPPYKGMHALTSRATGSNPVAVFSFVPGKPRSRQGKNEALAKVLCHNVVVLIHEMYELGIDPVFWAYSANAQKVPA